MSKDAGGWALIQHLGTREQQAREVLGRQLLLAAGFSGDVWVSSGLSEREQWEVSLGIYVSLQNAFESWQGGPEAAPVAGAVRLLADIGRRHSSFSEEDLLSDLIGFHRALMSNRSGTSVLSDEALEFHNEYTKKYFMRVCGVVGMDKPQSEFIETQNEIYQEYMDSGGFVDIEQWGRPCLGRMSGQFCPNNARIPYDLIWLQPEPPRIPDRGGKWFWSNAYFWLRIDSSRGINIGNFSDINQQDLNWAPDNLLAPV